MHSLAASQMKEGALSNLFAWTLHFSACIRPKNQAEDAN
jgi:hypothetical protein